MNRGSPADSVTDLAGLLNGDGAATGHTRSDTTAAGPTLIAVPVAFAAHEKAGSSVPRTPLGPPAGLLPEQPVNAATPSTAVATS